LAPLSWQA